MSWDGSIAYIGCSFGVGDDVEIAGGEIVDEELGSAGTIATSHKLARGGKDADELGGGEPVGEQQLAHFEVGEIEDEEAAIVLLAGTANGPGKLHFGDRLEVLKADDALREVEAIAGE